MPHGGLRPLHPELTCTTQRTLGLSFRAISNERMAPTSLHTRGEKDPRSPSYDRVKVQRRGPSPLLRRPKGKWMVSLVNSHINATSKRWHLWEIDLRFSLNLTPESSE